MANEFPTTVTPGALSQFLEKLKNVGVPEKIDRKYLQQIGFSSSNHSAFPRILKFVDLLDSSNKPTERYKKGLRGGEPGRVLVAEGIRTGYRTLFDTYPDANARSTEDITQFFKTHTDAGKEALQRTVATFQTLCEFGKFDQTSTPPPADPGDIDTDNEGTGTAARDGRRGGNGPNGGGAVTINVNIALSVDATSDPAVYDAFFAAMAKHIKVLDGGSANAS